MIFSEFFGLFSFFLFKDFFFLKSFFIYDGGVQYITMHLYLKNGNQQRWLVINLIDGNIPKIVGLSSPETSLLTDNLEPAIWFKVMLLESVSIDCSTRVVSWTNGKQHEGIFL